MMENSKPDLGQVESKIRRLSIVKRFIFGLLLFIVLCLLFLSIREGGDAWSTSVSKSKNISTVKSPTTGAVSPLEGDPVSEKLTAAFGEPTHPWYDSVDRSFQDYEYIVGKGVSHIKLQMSDDTRHKIDALTAKLVRQEVMLKEDHIWFPAKFYENNKVYNVKIRMRGDFSMHWKMKFYKSWRIKFKKDDLFHGIRALNLIVASDRAFFFESIGFHMARSEGLLSFRDGFAYVRQIDASGKRLSGPLFYVIAEAATKEFLEANNRPVTAIFRKLDLVMETRVTGRPIETFGDIDSPGFYKNYIKDYGREAQYWSSLEMFLKSDSHEELSAILDVDKYAIADAIACVVGTYHTLGSNNIFFYYNDTVGLFEPLLWDLNVYPIGEKVDLAISLGVRYPNGPLRSTLRENRHYRKKRDEAIWRFVADDGKILLNLFDYLYEKVIIDNLGGRSMPVRGNPFPPMRSKLKGNVEKLKRVLSNNKVSINVTMTDEKSTYALHRIEVNNNSFAPVSLDQVQIDAAYTDNSDMYSVYLDKNRNDRFDDSDPLVGEFKENSRSSRLIFVPEVEQLIYSRLNENYEVVADKEVFFFTGGKVQRLPKKFHFALTNQVTGNPLGRADILDSFSSHKQVRQVHEKSRSKREFLDNYPMFISDPNEKRGVLLTSGTYEFKEDVVIPKGIPLRIEKGAILRFATKKSLFSYSPVKSMGSRTKPVVFEALDKDLGWGVLAVIGPLKEKSELKWTDFSGYSESSFANAFFSGGVSIYEAPAVIEHCSFNDGKGEDALNLKRSQGVIKNSVFKNNPSDAIDLDWSETDIDNNYFVANKGDSIDISGTSTTISNNVILDNGDKGISLGEKSDVVMVNNFIARCEIGMAVKDLSKVEVYSTTFLDNKVGIAAYQKKAIFGGGTANVFQSVLWNNEVQTSLDPWSKVNFENSLLQKVSQGKQSNFTFQPKFIERSRGDKILTDSDGPWQLSIEELTNIEPWFDGMGMSTEKVPRGYFGTLINGDNDES